MKNAKHGDISWYQPNVINAVVEFFKAKLGAPKEGGIKTTSPGSNL